MDGHPGHDQEPRADFVNAQRQVLLSIPSDQPSVSGLPTSMYFHQPTFDRQLRVAVMDLPNVTVGLRSTDRRLRRHPAANARSRSPRPKQSSDRRPRTWLLANHGSRLTTILSGLRAVMYTSGSLSLAFASMCGKWGGTKTKSPRRGRPIRRSSRQRRFARAR